MAPCRATNGTHTCCRIDGWVDHPMPHMAADGTQWDEHGLRRRRSNDPYRTHQENARG